MKRVGRVVVSIAKEKMVVGTVRRKHTTRTQSTVTQPPIKHEKMSVYCIRMPHTVCVLIYTYLCQHIYLYACLCCCYFSSFSSEKIMCGQIHVCVCVCVILSYVWNISFAMPIIYSVDCRKQSVESIHARCL